jgi:hypothetical protein
VASQQKHTATIPANPPDFYFTLSARIEIVKFKAKGVFVVDARLREGIRLFNAGRFFEAHESLEAFYAGTEEPHKPFVEGLIQMAAALRLACDFDEIKGPPRMVRQALIRLENYQPVYLGIKVAGLMHAMEDWANQTEKSGNATAKAPKISLQRFGLF